MNGYPALLVGQVGTGEFDHVALVAGAVGALPPTAVAAAGNALLNDRHGWINVLLSEFQSA